MSTTNDEIKIAIGKTHIETYIAKSIGPAMAQLFWGYVHSRDEHAAQLASDLTHEQYNLQLLKEHLTELESQLADATAPVEELSE